MGDVYKIVEGDVWRALTPGRPWAGTPLDLRDGYVHLSAGRQVAGTLAKHYAGRTGLVLLTVPEAAMPQDALRWEKSRGDQLFPHLYAGLDPAWVRRADPLEVDADGRHVLPDGVAS